MKTGDQLPCCNYRGIKILEQANKLFEIGIETRVEEQVGIDEMQFGYMPRKGRVDAIFIWRQKQEKHRINKKDNNLAIVNVEKAFDCGLRGLLRWAL